MGKLNSNILPKNVSLLLAAILLFGIRQVIERGGTSQNLLFWCHGKYKEK